MLTCSSRAFQRSWFTTGFLAAVIQPFRFQPWIHVVMPFFRYSESVTTSTSQSSFSARSPSIAARQLHPIVGGVRLAAPQLLRSARCTGESPPSRPDPDCRGRRHR